MIVLFEIPSTFGLPGPIEPGDEVIIARSPYGDRFREHYVGQVAFVTHSSFRATIIFEDGKRREYPLYALRRIKDSQGRKAPRYDAELQRYQAI